MNEKQIKFYGKEFDHYECNFLLDKNQESDRKIRKIDENNKTKYNMYNIFSLWPCPSLGLSFLLFSVLYFAATVSHVVEEMEE